MAFEKTYIPYGGYWTSPFCRWQGSLSGMHSMKLAAEMAVGFLADRQISAEEFDGIGLGISVPQMHSFYGAPWLAGMIGAAGITGPTFSQACATSARMVASTAYEIESGQKQAVLAIACDRTSNGAHIYYPDPKGIGGMGKVENPVWDNFSLDPYAGGAMIDTAENVAAELGITKEEQDAIAVMRNEQYQKALADDRAFQRRTMRPVEIKKRRKVVGTIDTDEGVHPTTAEGLAGLKPAKEGGTVSFGTQTYPADGNAGLILCNETVAKRLSRDTGVTVRVLAHGETRVKKGFMPAAVAPAALHALERAGVKIGDCAVISTHNPFAVNDIAFCRETGVKPEDMNRYGSPLVWGHPQAPTGLRVIMELIEELALRGGGIGLFSGCAAGDSAMSVVLRVDA